MKVTQNSTYRLMNTNLNRITNNLEELRSQGASGLKLNKPSDDPSSIRPVLTTRTQIRHTERYLETMGVTLDKMQSTDGHLNHVENIMQRAKEITINAINAAMSNEDLTTLADEISLLREEMLDAANAVVDGKHIFAGYEENTVPFVVNPAYDPTLYDPTNSTTWAYIYNGDANPTDLEITPGEHLQANLTGNDLFLGVSNANWVDSSTSAINQPEVNRVDLFSVLTRVEEAIRANNIDDPAAEGGGMQNGLRDLEIGANQERRLRSRLGNRATRVESAMQHQEGVKVDLKQILSRYQDADIIETLNDIAKQENAFQAALNITGRVSQISILDYF